MACAPKAGPKPWALQGCFPCMGRFVLPPGHSAEDLTPRPLDPWTPGSSLAFLSGWYEYLRGHPGGLQIPF